MIKVSIIIPAYNSGKYISDCISSVLCQKEKDYDLEVLVIDDGSKDNTKEVVESFASKLIRYVYIENSGVSTARNVGIEAATGDYISFLDSDDMLSPGTFRTCLSIFERENIDIVFFGASSIVESNKNIDIAKFSYNRDQNIANRKISTFNAFIEMSQKNNYIVQPCLYMYSASSFKDLRFKDNIIHEDNLFTTQLLLHDLSYNAYVLKEMFYVRRVRDGSIMTKSKTRFNIDSYFSVAEELLVVRSKLIADRQVSLYLTELCIKMVVNALIDSVHVHGLASFNDRLHAIKMLRNNKIFPKSNKLRVLMFMPELYLFKRRVFK